MNKKTRERFAQLAMYIAGFGLMDQFVKMTELSLYQRILLYLTIGIISWYLFSNK